MIKPYALLPLAIILLVYCNTQAQTTSLKDILRIAQQNNLSVKQARSTMLAGQYNLKAEQKSYLPKIDLLSSYTYLSSPLNVNLQTVKDGIVEGSSRQSVNAANEAFKEITGSDLAQPVKDRIYNASKTIIGAVYPDYNPPLSKQSYFVAGLGVRQPIYLGNKLDAAQNLAEAAADASSINVQVVNKQVDFLVTAQYLRIIYLNTILSKQQFIVEALERNRNYAAEMVKNKVLPPYQKNWTNVVLTQAQANYNNIQLEKQNALVELNKLMGAPLDSAVSITDTLHYIQTSPQPANAEFWTANPVYQLVSSKTSFARTAEKISRSFSLPNIFAIGNYNLYQRDLPVITPDWFVGVEMQWTLFNGQTRKRTQAARQLIDEARLAQENTGQVLQVQLRVALNKMAALQNEVTALNAARSEAVTTAHLVNERMKNQLSAPRDVNDALLIEAEIEKAYYTAVLGYYIALAEYYNILGKPQQITEHIQ